MRSRILFVDDEAVVLDTLQRLLYKERDAWEMHFRNDPEVAWELMTESEFDAVVLDVRMPRLDGIQLMARMATHPMTDHVPVIFLTGERDSALKRKALEDGATDFLAKPVDSSELRARLRSAVRLKEAQNELRRQNEALADRVAEKTREVHESRLEMIYRLAKAAEYRDEETGHHVVRVGCYAREIGNALGLGSEMVESLYHTAPLHDIGKIGIPDNILLKPGRLTPAEWKVMKEHCAIGLQILRDDSKAMSAYRAWHGGAGISSENRRPDPLVEMACEIVMSHHEKWNGSGYPYGISGKEIPLSGRIVAICDVFDALTSERPYKPAYSEEKALAIIKDGVGNHFDPAVYEAFLTSYAAIRTVRIELSDGKLSAEELREVI